jgi:DNA-binding NtrC family response regulator
MSCSIRKILVVDEDEGIRLLFQNELMEEGYDVITIGDKEELIDFISRIRPDLLILDVKIGKEDAKQILSMVEKIFTTLPVILYTDYPRAFQGEALEKVNVHMIKKFNIDDLKTAVKELNLAP